MTPSPDHRDSGHRARTGHLLLIGDFELVQPRTLGVSGHECHEIACAVQECDSPNHSCQPRKQPGQSDLVISTLG